MDFTPLRRHRDYRWLFSAQFVSFLGTMVTYVALPYQMFKLTGSSLAVGLLGLAELLPLLVTAFLGGALADAVDRRRMVLVTEVGLGLGTRTRQELIGTYVVDIVAMVFGMPLALFPALSQSFGGPKTLGMLYAAPACGALVASLTSRWTHRVHRHGLAVMLAATVWGLAIVAFGFSSRFVPGVLFLALAGGADAVSGIFRMTLWNQTIPDSLRGRMAGIEMVSYTSGPLLGHVEAGLVAAAFSVRTSVVSGGVLCVVGVLLCGLLLPRFVAYDARRAGLSPEDPIR